VIVTAVSTDTLPGSRTIVLPLGLCATGNTAGLLETTKKGAAPPLIEVVTGTLSLPASKAMTVFALTPEVSSQRRMALYRNVQPLYLEQGEDRDAVLRAAEDLLVARGLVQRGDLIVLTIGEPMGKSGGTNAIKIVRVGEHR